MRFLLAVTLSIIFASAKAKETISVQTLNTYMAFYAEEKERRQSSILEFIMNNGSDIIFLQEVLPEQYYKNIEELSGAIGLNSIVYDSLTEQRQNGAQAWFEFYDHFITKRQSGLVTIVNGNIRQKEIHYFFPFRKNFYGSGLHEWVSNSFSITKGFGAAHITHPKLPENPIWTINVHLHHLSQEARLRQLVHCFQWFLSKINFEEAPVVFGGDFNFEPDSLEFEMIKYLFRLKEPQAYLGLDYSCTLCEENNPYLGYHLSKALFMNYEKTADYIFFRSPPHARLIPKQFSVFPKKYNGNSLSDHYGVRVDMEVGYSSEILREISKRELEERIQKAFETLDRVQSQLGNTFFSEHQFLNSLRSQLEEPDSPFLQYLKRD